MLDDLRWHVQELHCELTSIYEAVAKWVDYATFQPPQRGPVRRFLSDSDAWIRGLQTWIMHAEKCEDLAVRLPGALRGRLECTEASACFIISSGLNDALQSIDKALKNLATAQVEMAEFAQVYDSLQELSDVFNKRKSTSDDPHCAKGDTDSSDADLEKIKARLPEGLRETLERRYPLDFESFFEIVYFTDLADKCPGYAEKALDALYAAVEIVEGLAEEFANEV